MEPKISKLIIVYIIVCFVISTIVHLYIVDYSRSLYWDHEVDKLLDLHGFLFWGVILTISLFFLYPYFFFLYQNSKHITIDVYPKDILKSGRLPLKWHDKRYDYIDFKSGSEIVRIKDNIEMLFDPDEKPGKSIDFYIEDHIRTILYIKVYISFNEVSEVGIPIRVGFKHQIFFKDGTSEMVDRNFYENYGNTFYFDSDHGYSHTTFFFLWIFFLFTFLRCFWFRSGGHTLTLDYFVRLWESFTGLFC